MIDDLKGTKSQSDNITRLLRDGGALTSIYRHKREYPRTGAIEYKPDYDGKIPLPAYAGSDIVTIFTINGRHYNVYNITTLSIDSNRQITPIPTLGRIRISRFARGHRYIAGSIVLLSTSRGAFGFVGPNTLSPDLSTEIVKDYINIYSFDSISDNNGIVLDKLPPFDVSISYMDEYGRMSYETLYGVVIYRESKVVSINDLVTEITCSYYALDRQSTVESESSRLYYGGYNDKIAENIILSNNIAILEMMRDKIAQMYNSGMNPIPIQRITNTQLGTLGKLEYYDSSYIPQILREYDECIVNLKNNNIVY